MTVKVSEYGKQGDQSFEMNCLTCKGTGEVNRVQLMLYKQEIGMWCQCGNPSQDADYFEDGKDPVIGKHHWKCKDCGKVTQVG